MQCSPRIKMVEECVSGTVYMKIHVLAIGVEMINKQAATMAYKIHKTQPQRLRKY